MDNKVLYGLDNQISDLKDEFCTNQKQIALLDKDLKEVTSTLTTEELIKTIDSLKLENKELSAKVKGFKNGKIKLISDDEIN